MRGETWTIIGVVITVSVFLAGQNLYTTTRLDSRIDGVHREAVKDRRIFQAGMDTFRQELLAIAERQARLEGPLLADVPRTGEREP